MSVVQRIRREINRYMVETAKQPECLILGWHTYGELFAEFESVRHVFGVSTDDTAAAWLDTYAGAHLTVDPDTGDRCTAVGDPWMTYLRASAVPLMRRALG